MNGNGAIGRKYVEAISARDLETAAAMWKPGGIDNLVGIAQLRAPDEVVAYFEDFYRAIPNLRGEVVSVTADDDRAVVLWRMSGTFNGVGSVIGVAPNGKPFELLGVDYLQIQDGKIVSNTSISNAMDFARQIALLPAQGSVAERIAFSLVNSVAPILRTVRARRTK